MLSVVRLRSAFVVISEVNNRVQANTSRPSPNTAMAVEAKTPNSRITGSNNYQMTPNQALPSRAPRSGITGFRTSKSMTPDQRAASAPVPLIRPPKIKKTIASNVAGSRSPGTRTPLRRVSPLPSQGQGLDAPQLQDTEAIRADSATLAAARISPGPGGPSPERVRTTQPGPSRSSQKP